MTARAMYLDVVSENVESKLIIIRCSLYFCRRTISHSGDSRTIEINTTTKTVLVDDGLTDELRYQNYEADNERDHAVAQDNTGSDSSVGKGDGVVRLPRNIRRRKNYYRRERVKNDIVHLFFRFQRVLSKEHGAYFSFITALRDAFFILNQNDLDECFQVLRDKCNLTDEEIYKRMRYRFSWFLKRVRRHVPEPAVLERRYLEVYNEYKDIICAKTGKKLFGTKEAEAAHQSALKHIRRNCVSDMPFESYYSPIRQDKYGLTIYRCHRGTPGNEGIHQKIRQLVRGFNNSPRFMFALLSDYFLMWNQKIDISLRGLPSKYDGVYCGDLLEQEIECMAKWKSRVDPPHPNWLSTRTLECSNERFGFLEAGAARRTASSHDADSESISSSDSIIEDAEYIADELENIDDGEDDAEGRLTSEMPASGQWMARLHGRFRPYGKIVGNVEWEYFQSNIANYQGRDENETDNFSNIRWSAFADAWNKWVDELGATHPEVTYKSASYLKDAYKSMQRRTLQSSTIRPHEHRLQILRKSHTNEDANRSFNDEFQEADRACPIQPQQSAIIETQNSDSLAETSEAQSMPKKRGWQQRCRRCGKFYASQEWRSCHKNNIDNTKKSTNGKYLRNGEGNKVWDNCTVEEKDFEDGFPILDPTIPLRRVRRSRKRSHT